MIEQNGGSSKKKKKMGVEFPGKRMKEEAVDGLSG